MTLTPQDISDVLASPAIPDTEKMHKLTAIFDAAASKEAHDGYKQILLGERKKLAQDIIRATDTGPYAAIASFLEGINAEVGTGAPDRAKVDAMFDGISAILKKTETSMDGLAAENGRLVKTFGILAAAEFQSKTYAGDHAMKTASTYEDLAGQGLRINNMKLANDDQKTAVSKLRELYKNAPK